MPSTELRATVAEQWRRLPGPFPRLRVGFSGGLDSTVLLHVLAGLREELGFVLSATHVSHGLVAGAEVWGEHCRAVCAGLHVPFEALGVQVDRRHPGGLEAAARDARRRALSPSGDDALVVLAQHRNDQAETVLFRLLRGAGVKGAAGMRSFAPGGEGGAVWRPLLDVPRAALLAYAQGHGLGWIEDPSNEDEAFSRNFLRLRVLPLIATRFPSATASLARSGRLFDEGAGLLDELADMDLARLRLADGRYGVEPARALSGSRLRNVLRRLLALAGETLPDEERLCELERQFRLPSAMEGWRGELGGVAVCVYRAAWWVERRRTGDAPEACLWTGQASLSWCGASLQFLATRGEGLAAARLLAGRCELRRRGGGERMALQPGGSSRSLKNLFQEAGVPPWLRAGLPLLWVDGQLAWAAGVGVAAAFRCPPGEAGILPQWTGAA
ncbi:tRNA lysidine(34) synthetase TilS [Zoogloea sp.]|uniref:tRNA lysidine(34) synthetase TilS n=1 Tax=Zoogloea sp. TaxID=49181 RepID=UPI0014158967|nr:MAG: tRNA lysidine(34) synthetase TilS [Zoogloea sp.]